MTEHLTDVPKIPKELEPLAEEARKYKSAEEFVKWWNKEEVNIFATGFPPMETRGNLLKAGYRLPEGSVDFKSFYNQAVKGIKPKFTPVRAFDILGMSKKEREQLVSAVDSWKEKWGLPNVSISRESLSHFLEPEQIDKAIQDYNKTVAPFTKIEAIFKVDETVQQKNIYTGEIINKGKITKIVRLSTPATGFIPKNYYEIEGKGLIAEDLLERVEKHPEHLKK